MKPIGKKKLEKMPLKLVKNKIARYPGGREIDHFRGIYPGKDDGLAEAWIGSDTSVIGSGLSGNLNEGCAQVELPNQNTMYLKELISMYPEELLGKEHNQKFDGKLGVLFKLLDPGEQLEMQCHPSRKYAKERLNSDFGKEEAWLVLDTRTDLQEAPYVLFGFQPQVSREKFRSLYEAGDVKGLEGFCHKLCVQPGDIFIVKAGVPHAVGGGCLMIEIQEASDITFGVTRSQDFLTELSDEDFEMFLLDAYDYTGYTEEEVRNNWKVTPSVLRSGKWGLEEELIGEKQTPYFTMRRMMVYSRIDIPGSKSFRIGVVTEGCGFLVVEGKVRLELKKGDEFFLPAQIEKLYADTEERMQLVLAAPAPSAYEKSFDSVSEVIW